MTRLDAPKGKPDGEGYLRTARRLPHLRGPGPHRSDCRSVIGDVILHGVNSRATSPRLIGRAAELGLLSGALDRSAAGQPSLVLIGGEARIGKSRLLAEFLAAARTRDAAVMV